MTNIRNKQRPFRMLKYLYENTDENHPVSTPELVRIFQAEDAHASRKTVKDDIDVLVGEGFDIVTIRSTQNSFFLANRKFELPELKLLIDAVSSSKFISKEKSEDLIRTANVFKNDTGIDVNLYAVSTKTANPDANVKYFIYQLNENAATPEDGTLSFEVDSTN